MSNKNNIFFTKKSNKIFFYIFKKILYNIIKFIDRKKGKK